MHASVPRFLTTRLKYTANKAQVRELFPSNIFLQNNLSIKQKFTKYALNIRYSFPFNIIILTLQCSIKLYSRNACSLFAATLFSLLPMALILSLAIHPFCVDIYGLFYTMMWSGAYI